MILQLFYRFRILSIKNHTVLRRTEGGLCSPQGICSGSIARTVSGCGGGSDVLVRFLPLFIVSKTSERSEVSPLVCLCMYSCIYANHNHYQE